MLSEPAIADQYLDAFRSRRAYAQALVDLSAEQAELVAAEDYPGLVALLTHKQQLIDALLESGREPVSLWQSWQNNRDQLPNPVRHECESILDDAQQLLDHLLTSEAHSTTRLQQQRNVAERLLGEVNHGREAFAAYEVPSDPIPIRRLDLDL